MREICLRFHVPTRAEPKARGKIIAERVVAVARLVHVDPEDVLGGGRAPSPCALLARRIVAYTLRVHDGLTYAQIAEGLVAPVATVVYLIRCAEHILGDRVGGAAAVTEAG